MGEKLVHDVVPAGWHGGYPPNFLFNREAEQREIDS
jgi:hypothetical protein